MMMASKSNNRNKKFHSNQASTLGDYIRNNNVAWRTQNYPNQQRDSEWYRYLRQQANLSVPSSLPYGKRRSPLVQTGVVYEDDDTGLRKLDFHSPPVTLTWSNLQATAPPLDKGLKRTLKKAFCPWKEFSEPKMLLKGVSGIAKPGQLVAIMGASGAGKTTLMNMLTARRPGSLTVLGEVRVNGTNMGRNINRVAGYVQQEELFVPSMTTREHLYFHAMLRLKHDIPKKDRIARVDEILEFLNLKKSEKTMIGEAGRIKGLSGGEKRRLLFATEVLTDPPLLFADEPTSGLDASMAFVICEAMRKLCDQGKTIVCTIHQPSSEIFQLFDTLYLLAEGRLAYFGSRGKAKEFFASVGFEAPQNYNLADFYIQTLAILPFDREASLERVEYICDQYEQTGLHAQYSAEIEQYNTISDNQSENSKGLFTRSSKYRVNFFTQIRWLIWRSTIDMFRNPFEFRIRFILSIVIGIIFGLIFFRLEYDQQAYQNLAAIIFMLIINTSFSLVQDNAERYNRQLPLFFKEHDDGIYRTIPYYFSRVLLEIPTYALTSFVTGTIVYWMTNLFNDGETYIIFQGILILCAFVSGAAGSMLAVITPTPDAAIALVVPFIIPLMVFGGFFLNTTTVPDWLIWIKFLSWLYYSNEMAQINQWEDVTSLECNQMGNTTCFRNGTDILNFYGFKQSNYNRNLGLLFALLIGFRSISLGVLLLRAKFQRRSA